MGVIGLTYLGTEGAEVAVVAASQRCPEWEVHSRYWGENHACGHPEVGWSEPHPLADPGRGLPAGWEEEQYPQGHGVH